MSGSGFAHDALACAGPVGAGDDLEQMAVRVLEIEAAAAVVPVDLAGPGLRRIRPVSQALRADAPISGVEFRLTDQEGIMLARDLAFPLVEIEGHMIVELDHEEM